MTPPPAVWLSRRLQTAWWRRPRASWVHNDAGVWWGGLTVALLALLDTAPGAHLSAGFGVGVLVTSVLTSTFRTALVGGWALACTVVAAQWEPSAGEWGRWLPVVVCAALVLLAAALSLSRSRTESRLRRVSRVADAAQSALLREVPAVVEGVEFATRYLSAADEARVGGDLYEVVSTPWGVRLIMGDVRGKGLEALHTSAAVMSAFRLLAFAEQDLEELAAGLDEAMSRLLAEEEFVTAVVAELVPGSVRVVNMGHHPPLLLRDGVGSFLEDADPSPPIGIGVFAQMSQYDVRIGDRVLFYTDGLVEIRDRGGEFFPLEDQHAVLGAGSVDQALARLVEAATRFGRGRTLSDDMALVLCAPASAGVVGSPVL